MISLAFERLLFACCWLLVPIYAGLAAIMLLLLVKFAKAAYVIWLVTLNADSNQVTLGMLDRIDISLVANLLSVCPAGL